MLAKRIIPCLDVAEGQVKKGINFGGLTTVGNPVELAKQYESDGADELVLLDITATLEGRNTFLEVVQSVADELSIPFTVGGGIKSIDEMDQLLKAGADKVSINSAAVYQPRLIREGALRFGSQCMVVAIDVKYNKANHRYEVFTAGGTKPTGLDAIVWAKQVVDLGAGELLVTSMDRDGTKTGFAIDLYKQLGKVVNVPVIASGGAGSLEDIENVFTETKVSGALAASIFHYAETSIPQVKQYLTTRNIPIRIYRT